MELGVVSGDALVVYRDIPSGLYHAGMLRRRRDGEWEALAVADVPTPQRWFPSARAPFQAAALIRGPVLPSRLTEVDAPVKSNRITTLEGPRVRTIRAGVVAWRVTSDAAGTTGRLTRYGRVGASFTWRLLGGRAGVEVLLAPVDQESALIDLPARVLEGVEFWCAPEVKA